MSSDTSNPFSFGRVIARAFQVIGRNWAAFLLLSFLAEAPQVAWTYYSMRLFSGLGLYRGGFINTYMALSLGNWVLSLIVISLLQAAITTATIADLNGRRASIAEQVGAAARNFLPLVALSVLHTLGVSLGILLLIVPGLMLITIWAVIVPVRVMEHAGIGRCFGRSAELTAGYRWPIFGLLALFAIIVMTVNYAARPLFGLALVGQAGNMLAISYYYILSYVVRIVANVISTAGTASLYYELRLVKEGVGPAEVAKIFE